MLRQPVALLPLLQQLLLLLLLLLVMMMMVMEVCGKGIPCLTIAAETRRPPEVRVSPLTWALPLYKVQARPAAPTQLVGEAGGACGGA